METADFVLIDFEGEPARPIEERRRKQSPLKDVVGMMRSFAYAAFAAVDRCAADEGEEPSTIVPGSLVGRSFGRISRRRISFRLTAKTIAANPDLLPPPKEAQILLDAYLLEKALYELLYELDNRPSWVRIPLNSILAL